MSVDLALLAKVEEQLAKRTRKHVTASDVLAVIDKESHGVPVFNPQDKLYRANLSAACKLTGLSPSEVECAMRITFGAYQGRISKFRAEPGYWKWAQKYKSAFKPEDLLLLSCSFGLGQKMSRWLVSGVPVRDWIPTIKNFMGSINLQIAYCAGDLDQLMVAAKGDKTLAFTRYNAGPSATKTWAAYKHYGQDVAARAASIEKQLKDLKDGSN